MTEKFLTLSEKEFKFLLRKNAIPENMLESKKEAYRYSKVRQPSFWCHYAVFVYVLLVVEICHEIAARLSRFETAWYRHI